MRSSSSRRNQRGFTLVEMLIVIGIIVFLIALLLPAARRSIEAGRQVTCLNHLRQIAQATLLYCQDNDGAFPGLCGYEPPLPYEWIYGQDPNTNTSTPPFNDVSQSPIMRYMARRDPAVLRCPSDDLDSHPNPNQSHPKFGPYRYSYVINAWTANWPAAWPTDGYRQQYGIWPASHLRDVKDPSQKVFFLEEDPRYIDDGAMFIKIFLSASQGPFAEPPSFVHDVYREPTTSAGDKRVTDTLGWTSRTNAVFCDGHGEFVRGDFIVPGIANLSVNNTIDRAHFDPHL